MTNFEKYNVSTVQNLMRYFESNMKYGFTYRGKVFTDLQPDFQKNMDKYYKLRIGEDFIKNKYGVCWDFCELEREFFISKNINHECFFIESFINREKGGPTHTFALFEENGKWFWFEYAWLYKRGIWEFNSKEEALRSILEDFKTFFDRKLADVRLYKIERITKRLDSFEFVEKCVSSQKIKLDQ